MTDTVTRKVPKLRFRGFSDEWEEKQLKELAKIGTGKRDTQDRVRDGKFPFYVRSDTVERINSFGYDGEAILTSGDGVGVGKNFHYVTGKFDYHQRVYSIRDFKAGADSKYIYQYFSAKFYKRVIRLSAKNSVDSVRMDMIADMPIPLPSKEEQGKIAGFLTNLDKKISALESKKELIRKYKKSVMQAIFSQKFRFKDMHGNNYSDWEEKTLNSVMSESRIKGHKGNNANKLTVKLWGKGVFGKIDKTAGSINTKYYQRKAGQFIYSKLDFLNCAFAIIPDYLEGFESTVDMPAFDIKQGYDGRFLLERVKQAQFYKKLGETADGSRKARRVHADVFLGFKMLIPVYEEQNKIADFLTSLDDKIELTERKLEQAKRFKSSLLQQMFV